MPTNYDIEYPKLQQKCQRLQARVEALEGIVTEAVGVCDDLIAKTDVYLGINDAYERHDLWEKRVQSLLDTCAQCGMPVKDSYTGRKDLLCEYHASE